LKIPKFLGGGEDLESLIGDDLVKKLAKRWLYKKLSCRWRDEACKN
jgi:hypothetical protein